MLQIPLMNNSSRKKSLEKLASPEQLDRLLVIIRFPGWIALLCLLIIIFGILLWSIFGRLPVTTSGLGIFFNPNSIELIQSDSEGVIEDVFVAMGDQVKKGESLIKIKSSGKGESKIVVAPADGRVLLVDVLRGEDVRFGTNLIWFQIIQDHDEKNLAYGFFSIEKGDQIQKGMRAQITFDSVRSEIYGKMEGVVTEMFPFASKKGSILRSIPTKSLREYLTKGEASVVVIIEPTRDPTTPSGYKWTTKKGPPYRILPGSVGSIEVFLEEKRPITYLIPVGEH